jgi:hypothetical protein
VSCNFKILITSIDSTLAKQRTNVGVASKLEILETARTFFNPQTRYRNPNYNIANVVEGQRVIVGTIGRTQDETKLFDDANIVYPGNTTERPSNTPVIIEIIANRILENHDGSKVMRYDPYWQASSVAIANLQQKISIWSSVLPNHGFKRNDYAFG